MNERCPVSLTCLPIVSESDLRLCQSFNSCRISLKTQHTSGRCKHRPQHSYPYFTVTQATASIGTGSKSTSPSDPPKSAALVSKWAFLTQWLSFCVSLGLLLRLLLDLLFTGSSAKQIMQTKTSIRSLLHKSYICERFGQGTK